jgi:hypothetical protein
VLPDWQPRQASACQGQGAREAPGAANLEARGQEEARPGRHDALPQQHAPQEDGAVERKALPRLALRAQQLGVFLRCSEHFSSPCEAACLLRH